MRGKWAIFACLGVALLAGACDPMRDMRYMREGIGTDLYWDGLANTTELQNTYLSYICAQAISPAARSGDAAACGFLSLAPREWGLLVQAGMNDIDLRCDSYLAWLHDKRASREPFLKQLAAMGGATAGILKATDQSALSIALAGIAFGLAADTFTNIDMRLLNGVDYTTVQSVVRGNRSIFRGNNLSVVIDNRPAAIYVLRSYLTLCMPSSIEMSINNTINVFQRGGAEALREPAISLRMPVATSGTSAAVRTATSRVNEQSQLGTIKIDEAYRDYLDAFNPRLHSRTYVEGVLSALCVAPGDFKSTAKVKALIGAYEAGLHQGSSRARANGLLDGDEMSKLNVMGPCPAAYRNAYERTNLRSAAQQRAFIQALNRFPDGGTVPDTTPLSGDRNSSLRKKIEAVRRALQMQDPLLPDQVTPNFYDRLEE